MQQIAHSGVTVLVSSVPYSRDDLSAEAIRLLDDAPMASITEVSILPMAAGVSVEFNEDLDSPPARAQVSVMRGRLAKRRSASFGLSTGSEIRVSRGRAKQTFSRQNDSAPWKGGAEISTSGVGCSTGFAVGSWFGRYMLTAGHCVLWANNAPVYDGSGELMGYSEGAKEAKRDYRDSTLVRLNSWSNIGRIYDGGVSVGEFTKPVKGPVDSYVNQYSVHVRRLLRSAM